MARVPIERVLIPKPESPGRRALREQMPGPGGRLDVNPNHGYRRPYMHGAYPGYLGQRLDEDPPQVKALKRQMIDTGVDISIVEALDPADFIVTPDSWAVVVEGQTFRTTTQQLATAADQRTATERRITRESVKPAGYGGQLSMTISEAAAVHNQRWQSAPIDAPIIAKKISYHVVSSHANPDNLILTVEPIGWSIAFGDALGGAFTAGHDGMQELNEWILEGSVYLLATNYTGSATTDEIIATFTLSYERLTSG